MSNYQVQLEVIVDKTLIGRNLLKTITFNVYANSNDGAITNAILAHVLTAPIGKKYQVKNAYPTKLS